MVDHIIKGYEAPESALRPEVQTGEERDTERVKQLEDAALSTLPEEFKDYFDATRAEGFGLNSGYENHKRFLVFNTRKKIFGTLKKGGVQYEETLKKGKGEFSGVESEVWNQRRASTIKSIENRGVKADTSLLVAEGYERILESAMGQLESDWKTETAAAEQYFADRGFWSKIGGLWRKKRFDIFNRRFTKRLAKRKAEIQRSIDSIKGRKKRDVKNAENLITAGFRNADDQRKEVLWKAVRDAVNDPHANGSTSALAFKIQTEYTDFLEAIKNKGMIEDVMSGRRSTALERDTSARIETLRTREEGLRGLNPNFNKLEKTLVGRGVNPSEESLNTEQIAREIEAELTGDEGKLDDAVYGGKQGTELSPAEKLMYFSVYLEDNLSILKGLNNDVKRKFLKYLKNLDKETENDFEDTGDLAKAEKGLKETIENVQQLTGQSTGIDNNLKELATVLDVDKFDAKLFDKTCSSVEKTFLIFDGNYTLYESLKLKFPEKEQAKMDMLWNKLKTARSIIEKNIKQWKEDVRDYKAILKDKIPTTNFNGSPGVTNSAIVKSYTEGLGGGSGVIEKLEKELTLLANKKIAMQGVPSSVVGGKPVSSVEGISAEGLRSLIDGKERTKQKAEEKLSKIRGAYDNLQRFTFTQPDSFYSDVVQVGELKFEPIRTSIKNPDKKLKDRAKKVLVKEFRNDITEKYLGFLEKNTTEQFDILQKIPEGATVSLNFRETIADQLFQMPKSLEKNLEKIQKLRVIRKNGDWVMLEGKDQIYVLTGPSVKGGEARSNLGIYKKMSKEGKQITTLNAPEDFVLPHSNPNQQAIVLSMQVS